MLLLLLAATRLHLSLPLPLLPHSPGATPAQIAAGMPAVQAVSVLVPAGQGSSGQVLGQNLSSQTLSSQVTGQSGSNMSISTLGGASMRTAAMFNQALGGSSAGLLSVGSPGALSSDTASASSQLSNALTNLVIAQHQQQQQQQQQAAATALLQAAASSASSAMLPSISSNMSLSNMRSTSASSSVMSGTPHGKLDPIPSSAPSSGSMTGAKVGSWKAQAGLPCWLLMWNCRAVCHQKRCAVRCCRQVLLCFK
jgi:hypothetical protein